MSFKHRAAACGQEFSYSHQAFKRLFGKNDVYVPCDTFRDVLALLHTGGATAAIMPVWNSSIGDIPDVVDLLGEELNQQLWAGRSCTLPVRHALIGTPDADLEQIHTVIAAPAALAQCADNIAAIGIKTKPHADTAGAVATIMANKDPGVAAIASKKAAEHHGAKVLYKSFNDKRWNRTKFTVFTL